jgi:hypothetical protein
VADSQTRDSQFGDTPRPNSLKNYTLKSLSIRASRFSNNDRLGIVTLAGIALNTGVLLTQVLLFFSYSNLSKKPVPTLVQLSTGEAITATALGSKERSPEVITKFVSRTLTMLMSWSGTIPGDNDAAKPLPDSGVDIQAGAVRSKVTTSTYQAAFAISEDFRKEFLAELGKLTPSSVFNGTVKVIFVPLEIQNPVLIEPGKWKVVVIANLLVLDQSDITGKAIPFNKEVYLKAVEAPEFQPGLSGIGLAVQQMRASGLEIYAIRDLIKDDIK